MPAPSLPTLEQHLVACLIELEDLRSSRPKLPTAIARAEAGRQIDELYEQIAELRDQIEASPAAMAAN